MKLDPEHRIIAAALDQAAFEEANERAVVARIEFPREDYATVTMTISHELAVEPGRSIGPLANSSRRQSAG